MSASAYIFIIAIVSGDENVWLLWIVSLFIDFK